MTDHSSVPRGRSDDWQRTWGLIRNLTKKEISAQYKRTALGNLWSLFNPLATIAIFGLIFGVIFNGQVKPGVKSGMDSFALWIAIGIIGWGFLSRSVTGTMNSLIASQSLLTKVYFPRYVLAVSGVLASVVNHLPELFVLVVVVLVASGPHVLILLPLLAVAVVLVAVFALGLGLALSIALVYFRDLEHLWGIVTQVWMYASGVVFPLSMLDDVAQRAYAKGWALGGEPIPISTIFRFNPAETYLELYRGILYDGVVPPWNIWLVSLVWALAALGLGVAVYRKYAPLIVEEL